MDAIVQGHRRRARAAAQHRRHADRAGGAGRISPTRSSACCPTSPARRSRCSACSGIVMAPVCWLMGIPWDQAVTAGALMGIKTVLNELIAYVRARQAAARRARSALAADHALCDVRLRQFRLARHHDRAASTTMAPERRDDIVSLGCKSIVSGTLTTCLIGAIVGRVELTTPPPSRVKPGNDRRERTCRNMTQSICAAHRQPSFSASS